MKWKNVVTTASYKKLERRHGQKMLMNTEREREQQSEAAKTSH